MRYLNQNQLLHRDLKPDNILLDENDYLKLSDLFAAFVNCPHLSRVVLHKTYFVMDQTFVLCTNLTIVENIGYCTKLNYTFNHCTKLAHLDEMKSVTVLGNQTFKDCH